MTSVFARKSKSTLAQPELQPTSSLSTESSSSAILSDDSGHDVTKSHANYTAATKVNHHHQQQQQQQSEQQEGCWSREEQAQFIALILPQIKSKRLSLKEIQLIRVEAQKANLPEECVDRLLDESHQAHLQKKKTVRQENRQVRRLKKYKSKEFETIEDVDESDNILAYFSRMASLKQGGHFPRLNISALESFVEATPDDLDGANQSEEDIEVDWDVGYVNKSLDTSLDEMESWEEYEDTHSFVSSTIGDGRNRYEPAGHSQYDEEAEDAFGSLLVGGASPTSRHVTWDKAIDTKESADESEKAAAVTAAADAEVSQKTEDATLPPGPKAADTILQQHQERHDWTVSTGAKSTLTYGYEQDLDEWTRKQNMALWQPNPKKTRNPFSCQTSAEDVVADELCQCPSGSARAPMRLRGMAAVRIMMAKTEERRQRRQETSDRRHIPQECADVPKMWHLPYRERCEASPGYVGVDQFSLMETTSVVRSSDPRDRTPWELRDVRQNFLYDQSAAERNWFGRLRRKRGNDPNKFRPPRVRSMEMPTEASDASSTGSSGDGDLTTEYGANSKTTASNCNSTLATKSCKSKDCGDAVNKTASLSFSSGEGTDHDGDDEDSTRFGQSLHSHSVTTRSVNDGNSTFCTEDHTVNDGNSTLFTADLGMDPTTRGANTFSSYFGFRPQEQSMSMDADEIESTGVSEILDAGDHSDSDDEDNLPRSLRKHKGHATSFASLSTDRYVSSFSETGSLSTDYRNGSGTGESDSDSTSSSFCTSDDSSWDSDDGTWEDAPECGTFMNIRPKLGERVSRVTPDHTSHLLRSRFKKKHFPRGAFPYDKPIASLSVPKQS